MKIAVRMFDDSTVYERRCTFTYPRRICVFLYDRLVRGPEFSDEMKQVPLPRK